MSLPRCGCAPTQLMTHKLQKPFNTCSSSCSWWIQMHQWSHCRQVCTRACMCCMRTCICCHGAQVFYNLSTMYCSFECSGATAIRCAVLSMFCHLQAARDMVSDQLLPALEDSQLSKAAREAATQLSHLDVDKFPLGFTTGGGCDHAYCCRSTIDG